MKKTLAILMVLAVVTGSVFAQAKAAVTPAVPAAAVEAPAVPAKPAKAMPAPTVTAGFSAAAEINLVQENTVSSGEVSGEIAPKAVARPNGLKANQFVANQWTNLDWSKMSIKTEGKYDAFRATADDWSFLKVTTTWKDFFGLEVKYTYAQDNKEDKAVSSPANEYYTNGSSIIKNSTNEVQVTLDRTKDMGLKAYMVYKPQSVFGLLNFNATGINLESLFNGFTKTGFELDNEEIAANLIIVQTPVTESSSWGAQSTSTIVPYTIDTAKLTAKNMFGKWTAALNNSDEIKLRLPNLGSDSKIDRPEYSVGKDNKLQATVATRRNNMNVVNTVKATEELTITVATVVPVVATTAADWLNGTSWDATVTAIAENTNGDNIALAAAYKLAKVGTLEAGTSLDIDYLTTNVAGTLSGPSTYINGLATTKDWGTAIWFDANLSEMMGADKGLFVSLDTQFGNFYKAADQAVKIVPATDVTELEMGTMVKVNLYGETKMKLSDALTVSAGTLFSMGFGYDYASANDVDGLTTTNGASWGDTGDKNYAIKENVGDTLYVSGNYNEANDNNSFYGIVPFELKMRGDYIINKTATVWLSNGFKLNAGSLSDAALGAAPGKAMYGFYQKDAIELGVKLVSTPKSTLSISTGVNLFLGVPSSSDLYAPAATDAQKNAVDAAYGVWYTKNFNPFSAKVAYSYTY